MFMMKNLSEEAWDRNTNSMESEEPCTPDGNTEKLSECFPILLTFLLDTLKQ